MELKLRILLYMWKDICLGGETKNPEGTVKALLEAQGVESDAAVYYIINVSPCYVRETLALL